MTAKEIADRVSELVDKNKFDDITKLGLQEAIKKYARHKLKEQRELCANTKGRVVSEIKIENGDLIQKARYRKKTEEDILNAPEPKLD